MTIDDLNQQFAIENHLQIIEGEGGFAFIKIHNAKADALISLYGGQVLSYRIVQQPELLFLSDKAYYQSGKAIKGGVPICWPWFGNDPEDKGRPAHGFARNSLWQLATTEQLANGDTRLELQLKPNELSRSLWPHEFLLSLQVTVGDELTLQLTTHNKDTQAFAITQALHSYFAVESIDALRIGGLENLDYLDKAKSNTGAEQKSQQGEIHIEGEVDRIYLQVPEKITLKHIAPSHSADAAISLHSKNNATAVVWNPWQDLCAQSADLNDTDYTRFVCVETANAASDVISLPAGESFSLQARIALNL